MGGPFRPGQDNRRRSFDVHPRDRDREKDPRDRDIRDRNRDHDPFPLRRNDREDLIRGRDRDRDTRPLGPNRDLANMNKAASDRSSPAKSSDQSKAGQTPPASLQELTRTVSVTSNMSKSEGNPNRQSRDHDLQRIAILKRITDLLCTKQHWWNQREDIAKNQRKLQDDLRRSGSRHVEFASLHDTYNLQLKKMEDSMATCTKHIEATDQEIFLAIMDFLEKYGNSSQSEGRRTQEAKIRSLASDLESRFLAFQKSTTDALKSQMTAEISKLVEELKSQHESEVKALEKRLEQEASKTKLLEVRLNALTTRVEEANRETAKRMQELRAGKPQTVSANDEEAFNDIRKSSEKHEERISCLEGMCADRLELKSPVREIRTDLDKHDQRITAAQRQVDLLLAQFGPLKEEHSQKISSMQSQVDVLLRSSTSLKEEQNQKISSGQQEQSRKLSSVQQQLDSVMADSHSLKEQSDREISSMRSQIEAEIKSAGSLREQQERSMSSMQQKVDALLADDSPLKEQQDQRISSIQQKVDSLLADAHLLKEELSQQRTSREDGERKIAILESTITSVKESLEKQATNNLGGEIRKLENEILGQAAAMKSQKEKQAQMTTEVADLQSRLSKGPLKELQDDVLDLGVKNKSNEDKLAATSKDISLLKSALSEIPVNELKKLLREPSKVGDSPAMKSPNSRESPVRKTSNASVTTNMSDSRVLELVLSQVGKFEKEIQAKFRADFAGIAQRLGGFVDGERSAREVIEKDVQTLGDRVSSIEGKVQEVQTETARSVSNMEERMRQQQNDVVAQRNSISNLSTHLDSVRQTSKNGLDDLQMQMTHFNGWTSNFNSKSLYKSMVEQVNASIPNGVAQQVWRISERMDAFEARHDEHATKKRKVTNGTSVANNGGN